MRQRKGKVDGGRKVPEACGFRSRRLLDDGRFRVSDHFPADRAPHSDAGVCGGFGP